MMEMRLFSLCDPWLDPKLREKNIFALLKTFEYKLNIKL